METPNTQIIAALRIIDAASNRASEGMRVVEDHARFMLNDVFLTEQLKQLRHNLTSALGAIDKQSLLAARETLADVGTQVSTNSEMTRQSILDVVAASFSRIQQSLRSIEEYSKLVDTNVSSVVEQLRYKTYTLERCFGTQTHSLEKLADVQLYVLMDGQDSNEAFEKGVTTIANAGADIIQLRDKNLADGELLERAKILVHATRDLPTLAIINDRPDIAARANADGVHVGQDELSIQDARAIVGPNALIGVSTHSVAQLKTAIFEGADYLGVGPMFESGTKQFKNFPGLDFAQAAAETTNLPWFAIGGIQKDNLPSLLEAGVTRIAVSGAVCKATDPTQIIHELKETLTQKEEA